MIRFGPQSRSPAPVLLHGALREYQQIGVDWMVNLHKKHLNGILADETGLGKTVQTVAYMAQLAGQEGGRPTSLRRQHKKICIVVQFELK